uniref:Uncharacterized protein n=1 Tax=Anopheles farauti TaxID=69004 RepID=A0A182QKG5_9DIPT
PRPSFQCTASHRPVPSRSNAPTRKRITISVPDVPVTVCFEASSMKFVVLLVAALVAATSAQIRPLPIPLRNQAVYGGPEASAVILNQVYEPNPDGSYIYSYETSNGIRAEQRGFLKNPGTPGEAQVMQGSYSYTGPDGVVYTINYIADENGYRAEGAHIPSAPRYNQYRGQFQ